MTNSEKLYHIIEILLISQGIITQTFSDKVTRKGSRKYGHWKRHVIDLCSFVIEQREIEIELEAVLKNCIMWCKAK